MQTQKDTSTLSLSKRYLVTAVAGQSLAFLAQWVHDILVIERSQILALPFYHSSLLGVIHYQGKIVPLVLASSIFTQMQTPAGSQPTLIAVRLNRSFPPLTGVGLVIDRPLGSLEAEQLTDERIFQLEDLPDSLWQPQRWYST